MTIVPADADALCAPDVAVALSGTEQRERLLQVLDFGPHERVAVCYTPPRGRFTSQIVSVASAPRTAARFEDMDCWFGTAPLAPGVKVGRGKGSDVVGIRCVFVDLDYGPDKAGDEANCRAIIAAISARLGTEPCAIVHTGHGLHAYWPVKRSKDTSWDVGPDRRRDRAAAALAAFGDLAREVATQHGAKVDSVFELARVMRMPGTTNRKDPDAPVQTAVEYPEGARPLTLAEVEAACPVKVARPEPAALDKAAAAAPAQPEQPACCTPAYDDLDASLQERVDKWVGRAVTGVQDDLRAAHDWSAGHRDGKGRGWDKVGADGAYRLGRLSRASWNALTGDEARTAFLDACPTDGGFTAEDAQRKWDEQHRRADPAPWPPALDDTEAAVTFLRRSPGKIAAPVEPVAPDAPDKDDEDDEDDKFSAAAVVIEHVTRRYDIGVTPSGEPFAVPRKGPRLPVMLGMKGGALRARVTADLYDGKRVLRAQAVDDGFRVVIARAVASTVATVLHLRVAHLGDRIVIDLGQPGSARCIDVHAGGWKVLDNPPAGVLFQRTSATRPIPTPAPDGSLKPLRGLLGFDSCDLRWTLIRGWLVAQVFADIPRPLLLFVGAPGVAKTSHARQVVSVLDPREELGSNFGKAISDDQVKALSRFLVSYDNLASVSEVVSDHLCRLVSGDEIDKRRLFSDGELVTITYRRTGVMTAVTLPGLRSDALERVIVLGLDRITEDQRRSESALRAEFTDAHPTILGGLCDALSATLARLPAVRAAQGSRPRWADFYDVLSAYDPACALAYVDSLTESMADAADADPFVVAVCAWLASQGGTWKGAPQDAWLEADRHRKTQPGGFDGAQWWPKGGPQFSAALVRATEPLRAKGVTVERRRADGRRTLSLTTVTP